MLLGIGTGDYWNEIARLDTKLVSGQLHLGLSFLTVRNLMHLYWIKIDKLTGNITKSEPKLVVIGQSNQVHVLENQIILECAC